MEDYENDPQHADRPEESKSNGEDPNKVLTPEDIARLFAAQTEIVPEEKPAVEAPVVEPTVSEPEPTADPNKVLTPEDIAKLFAAQEDPAPEEVAIEEPAAEEPAPEPAASEPEPPVDPNKVLTPEDIAKLFAAQDDSVPDEVAVEEAAAEGPTPEPAVSEPEPPADPNKVLTPEDIARLFAAQDDAMPNEVAVEEPAAEEPAPEPAVSEPEPPVDPNKVLSPEDIAKLFAAQEDTAPEEVAIEEPAAEEHAPEPPASEPEPPVDPNKVLSPEDIAKLFAAQDDAVPEAEPIEEESAPALTELEAILMAAAEPETETSLDAAFSLEPDASDIPETSDIPVQTPEPAESSESPVASGPTDTVVNLSEDEEETATALDTDKPTAKVKTNILSLLVGRIWSLLPKRKVPVQNDQAPDLSDDTDINKEKAPVFSRLLEALKKPRKPKKAAGSKPVEEPATPVVESTTASEDDAKAAAAPKTTAPRRKSGLKTALGILGILFLTTGAFAAGFYTRGVIAPPVQDPAQLKAAEEAKANELRAKELAEINPKDYTSSMYLDSLILKGSAEKTTTVKLKKIDDVRKLTAFPNLRRIKIDGMTGDEDLSVIQELSGVEEIIIENSVLRNQFRNGQFDTVTYIEMYDSKVEDSSSFANFKNLTQFYAYSTTFSSQSNNLELTSYLPAIETLTLSNCGSFEELTGVQNLSHLKSLSLSSRTLIKNMSYTDNPAIERLKVDISFVEDIQQLQKLADLHNMKYVTIQCRRDLPAASQLSNVKRWVRNQFPDATVETATY